MFGWVSKVATSVASEVQQFGHNCVESIVGEEEEPTPTTEPKKSPVEPVPIPEQGDATAADEPNNNNGPKRNPRENEESGWAPTELRFVGRRTGQLAGWLVEKSAGVALTLLGDEPGDTDPTKEEGLASLAQQARLVEDEDESTITESHAKAESPIVVLRASRGYLGMLKKQELEQSKEPSENPEGRSITPAEIDAIILPSHVSEFDFTDDVDRQCSWVAATIAGTHMENIRKKQSTILDEETGATIHGEHAVSALANFPGACAAMCDDICHQVLDELAKLFSRPQRELSTTLAQLLSQRRHDGTHDDDRTSTKWYLHRRTADHSMHLNLTVAQHVSLNVMDLVLFGLCEMHRGCDVFCKIAQDTATWARRSNQSNAKQIKEETMRVRGECVSSNVNAVVLLEEALEIVRVIFPLFEGVPELEPLRIGEAMEFVKDPTTSVATEHGTVVIQASDRHERAEESKTE